MKTLIILSTAFDVSSVVDIPVFKGDERLNQYREGFSKFFELTDKIIQENFSEICLSDNTINNVDEIDSIILNALKDRDVIFNLSIDNVFGSKNKGSGLISSWDRIKDVIKKYDYIIHFEPKQLLVGGDFFSSFYSNPRNLFIINKNVGHFYTGVFSIKSEILLDYIVNISSESLYVNKISIEDSLFNFMKKYNYDTIEKGNLLWYDSYTKKTHLL